MCLLTDRLWSYSLEFDDVFYVNEPTGSTQWEWPADDVSSQRFWFWLSEQYKVDEHGHAISCTTAGGDVPQDRALHGFGRPQKTSTSTSGVTFRQKLSNFFVGDVSCSAV